MGLSLLSMMVNVHRGLSATAPGSILSQVRHVRHSEARAPKSPSAGTTWEIRAILQISRSTGRQLRPVGAGSGGADDLPIPRHRQQRQSWHQEASPFSRAAARAGPCRSSPKSAMSEGTSPRSCNTPASFRRSAGPCPIARSRHPTTHSPAAIADLVYVARAAPAHRLRLGTRRWTAEMPERSPSRTHSSNARFARGSVRRSPG